MAKEEWNCTVGKQQELCFGCLLGLYEYNRAEGHLFCSVHYWTKLRM